MSDAGRIRNLILSGGVAHDYQVTTPMLAETLAQVGIFSDIEEDPNALAHRDLADLAMITLNCVRWTCTQSQLSGSWRERAFALSQPAREAVRQFLAAGGSLLALHAATISFDDWSEYPDVIGARWEWGRSGHAPYGTFTVDILDDTHPITTGIGTFEIEDELYNDPWMAPGNRILATANYQQDDQPMLWVREYKGARVCYSALGHGPASFANTHHQKLLQRASAWVCGRS